MEPKVDFGVVNKSESVAVLTIFRANYFDHRVKVIDNVHHRTAFRSVNLLNVQQYGLLRSVSSYEGIRRFKELGKMFPILDPVPLLVLLWSCVGTSSPKQHIPEGDEDVITWIWH